MQYKVFGKPFPAVSLRMNRGESIYTQSGGMSSVSYTHLDVYKRQNIRSGIDR